MSEVWKALTNAFADRPRLAVMLDSLRLTAWNGSSATITGPTRSAAMAKRASADFANALSDIAGHSVTVRIESIGEDQQAQAPEAGDGVGVTKELIAEAEAHPLVQEALRAFDGEIRRVQRLNDGDG